tara:strand:- start:4340 stop:5389 length:1050 start_codon:yes stop_codon:yes gene_type:complete
MIKKLKNLYFSKKILNVNTDPADPKDFVHDSKIGKLNLPESFSRRNLTVPVKNQGNIGSCVGHSGRVLLGDANLFQKEEPSSMWIYKTAKKYDPWEGEDYSGTSIRGAATGLIKKGCCFESFWPYKDSENSFPSDMDAAELDASYKKSLSYKAVPCDDINEIKAILMDRPMWYGFMVHNDFFSLGFNGVVNTEKYLKSPRAGGHAVCLIGWKQIKGKLHWEFQNSWGSLFGNFGYFFLEHSLFKKVIINSIGPYYIEIKDGYFNPGPDPDPEPDPNPEPDPEPEPDSKDDTWLTPKVTWIVFGIMLSAILAALSLSFCSEEVDIPTPPYIDENGNINWDDKFKNDTGGK